ncbi:MAG: hypothetical protein LH610_13230 [Sphingomonas bacterium]|nr:hypothetical protein [Sphingomonas bacterium]
MRIRRVLAYVRLMQEPNSSERIQRVRIGLTGLAFVFLLVLLGTAVSRSGDNPAPGAAQANGLGNNAEPEEPLAQIGVAPGQSSSQNEASDAAQTP